MPCCPVVFLQKRQGLKKVEIMAFGDKPRDQISHFLPSCERHRIVAADGLSTNTRSRKVLMDTYWDRNSLSTWPKRWMSPMSRNSRFLERDRELHAPQRRAFYHELDGLRCHVRNRLDAARAAFGVRPVVEV